MNSNKSQYKLLTLHPCSSYTTPMLTCCLYDTSLSVTSCTESSNDARWCSNETNPCLWLGDIVKYGHPKSVDLKRICYNYWQTLLAKNAANQDKRTSGDTIAMLHGGRSRKQWRASFREQSSREIHRSLIRTKWIKLKKIFLSLYRLSWALAYLCTCS